MNSLRSRFAMALLAGAWLASGNSTGWAVTPESPEVKAVVEKALKYLESAPENRLGGKCLIGMAFLKNGADEMHPQVEAAVAACKAATAREAAEIQNDIYSTGIAIIFLCTLDPSKYAPEILKFRDSLIARQKPEGGWGYPERPTGDTSMTQYGVLSYWEISKAGLGLDVESTEKVANWILRTQDPGGSYGYQGREAEVTGDEKRPKLELVKQDSARHGMTAAGLGCTYMVADLLNLVQLAAERDAKLPPALRPLRKNAAGPLSDKVNLLQIKAAQERGRDWMRKNYKIDSPYFPHYYLYALERYQSFSEAAEGRYIKEPKWYNDGYAYLKKSQNEDGSWADNHPGLEAVNTAFATLFLLRSTKKAIERSKAYGEAALTAGRGLPPNSQEVAIRAGRIVQSKAPVAAEKLVDILHTPEHRAFALVASDFELIREPLAALPPDARSAQLARLRALVTSGNAPARLAAVKLLGAFRDLPSAEALIAALEDPDWRVVVSADDSLRLIARIVSPSALSDKPSPQQQADLIKGWRGWLLAIRPDAEFLN